MSTLQDVAGETGIFTDGNWILSENMDVNGKYGVIQLKHVGIGDFFSYKDFNFINSETFSNLGCTEVLPGDILISRMADPIGRACIVPQLPFPCVTAVDVTIVRVDKNIADSTFIMHLCNSQAMREQIDRAVRGTTRARITRTELGHLRIPLPSLAEQRRIAGILAKADRLRRLRRTARQVGETYLQSVFIEMFGKVRKKAKTVILGRITQVKTGGTPSRQIPEYFDGQIPWVKTTEVNNETIFNTSEKISEQGLKASNCEIFPVNTILLAMYGQGLTRGRSAKLAIQATTNQACAAILPSEKINTDFLWTYLQLSYNKIRDLGRGGNQPNLNLSMVRELEIPLPELPEQENFALIVQRYDHLHSQQREAERQAEMLFQSLLHYAYNDLL